MKYIIISNINIEHEVEAENLVEAMNKYENEGEFPKEYVDESLEIVKVLAECGNCSREIEADETRCERCKGL